MKKIFLIIISALAFVTCKKEKVTEGPAGTNGTNGTNGTVQTGNIEGKVKQLDENGNTYTVGLNTLSVSIDGTNNSTITDALGNYTLSNVSPGEYSISYSRNGNVLRKDEQISFPGNGTLYLNNSTVYDKATFTLTGGSVVDSSQLVTISFSAVPVNYYRNVIIIFGKTNAVDINNVLSYETYILDGIAPNHSSFHTFFPYSTTFNPVSFPSGSTIYFKIYPTNSTNFSYYDYPTDKYICTGCGNPLPTTFTLTMP